MMLFRLIVLVLVCICCLAILTSCTKEALTPCQKPPDTGNTSGQTSSNTNSNASNNSAASRTNKSLTASGETQYYIDPEDGKYKAVPDDPNQLPKDTTFLALDDEGNLVPTDVNGIPLDSQATYDKDKASKELERARLEAKTGIVDRAVLNINAATNLLKQQFDDNQQHTDVLANAQEIQSNTEQIITDQQQRVAFQQGNMSNMIYELRLSTNEAEQAASILKQAAKTAMDRATKAAGPAPAPAPGPSSYMSTTMQGPASGPASSKSGKQVATDVNVCRSNEMYGSCSNEMIDPSGKYVVTVRDDGDLVVTTVDDKDKYLFSTGTKDKGSPPYRLFLLPDSNLALYDTDNTAIWISGTSNLNGMTPPFRTKFVDGSFCVVDASDIVVWNSSWIEEKKKTCRSDRFGGVCNNEMVDPTGKYVATVRDDGDFVVTSVADKTKYLFSTETKGNGSPPYRLFLLQEGNLVLYDASNSVLWESGTSNVAGMKAPYRTKLHGNGDLLIVDAGDNHVWNSLTAEERKRDCRSNESGGLCSKTMFDSTRTYVATMRDDGDFVLTTTADRSKYLFSTNTKGKGKAPYRVFLQNDGNLVVFDADNKALWKSNTENPPYKDPLNPANTVINTHSPPYKLKVENGALYIRGKYGGFLSLSLNIWNSRDGSNIDYNSWSIHE